MVDRCGGGLGGWPKPLNLQVNSAFGSGGDAELAEREKHSMQSSAQG